MQRQLISQILHVRYKSSPLVGNSALYLIALTDNAGLDDNRVKKLIDIYYAALDVGVTGEVLSLPSNLRPLIWPEWMRGRSKRTDINYRPSPPSSILGRLHCSLHGNRPLLSCGACAARCLCMRAEDVRIASSCYALLHFLLITVRP